jgi:hypothetical protein
MAETHVISAPVAKRAELSGMVLDLDKRKPVTYAQLVEKLSAIGVVEVEVNIRNKLARGKFSAVFLVQCLTAIGSTEMHIG